MVLHDLLNHVNQNNPDHHSLSEALNITQNFLDQFNMIQTKSMFPVSVFKLLWCKLNFDLNRLQTGLRGVW